MLSAIDYVFQIRFFAHDFAPCTIKSAVWLALYSCNCVALPASPSFIPPKIPRARHRLLSLGAFLASLRLAGFPHIEELHGSHWQILALSSLYGAW